MAAPCSRPAVPAPPPSAPASRSPWLSGRLLRRGGFAPAVLCAVLSAGLVRAGTPPVFVEGAQFGAGATICVAWADVENDGDLDLAVGNTFNQQNFLYRNDGGTVFTEDNSFGKRNTFALAWGDYDNDGDRDMAIGNGSNWGNRLSTSNGDGTFTGSPQFGVNLTVAVAWADYDLDGDLDLAVGNGILGSARANYLYRNDGALVFTELTEFGDGQSDCVVWGDCDGDGDPDLAVGNGGFGFEEPNRLYVNNGDGTFTGRDEFGGGDTSCLVWGDADNDGDLDVAVANWNAGQNRLYVNDGTGTFTGLDRFGARDPNTMAWGDADNDGDLDLAVGNGDFGSADSNFLYVNEGGLVFTEVARFGLGSTDGVAWGDCDGDGDLDLAAGNEHGPDTNYLYLNQENDTDWLFLSLVGRFHEMGSGYSNRDGIGAKVDVYEVGFHGDPAHLLGTREIEAHGGFASGNAIDAHFGLPGHSAVDVRVTWPGSGGSHIVQSVLGVPVPSRRVVLEDSGPTSAPPAAASPGWRVAPNPTRGSVRLLRPPGSPGSGVLLVDSAGRLVRRLAGAGAVVWDGRDEAGRPVASGVYFVREVTGAPATRIVMAR